MWHELRCDRCRSIAPVGMHTDRGMLRRSAHRVGWMRTKRGQLPNQNGSDWPQPAEDLCDQCARKLGVGK